MLAGRSVVMAVRSPISPGPRQRRPKISKNRLKADPLAKCYMPGVPGSCIWIFRFKSFRHPRPLR